MDKWNELPLDTCCESNLRAFKEAGNSFQHFSNSYTSKDEYYLSLTSDATIMVSVAQSLVNKFRHPFYIKGYHSNNMTG